MWAFETSKDSNLRACGGHSHSNHHISHISKQVVKVPIREIIINSYTIDTDFIYYKYNVFFKQIV